MLHIYSVNLPLIYRGLEFLRNVEIMEGGSRFSCKNKRLFSIDEGGEGGGSCEKWGVQKKKKKNKSMTI